MNVPPCLAEEHACCIVISLYGKGHGKPATIARLKEVLDASDSEAEELFTSACAELGL